MVCLFTYTLTKFRKIITITHSPGYWNNILYNQFVAGGNNATTTDPMDIHAYNLTPKCSIREYEELLLNYTSSITNDTIRLKSEKELLIIAFKQRQFSRYLDLALFQAQLNINTFVDSRNHTMLFYACMNGEIEKVKYLLAAGADVKLRDYNGLTPLYISLNKPATFHPPEITRLLLRYGADPNALNNKGMSPLHGACLNKELEMIELLLKKKANVFVLDLHHMFPHQYAGEQQGKVLELYKKYAGYRLCKPQHERMWAHIISREFVTSIFALCEPSCTICKRKSSACAVLKINNYRLWLFVHDRRDKKLG